MILLIIEFFPFISRISNNDNTKTSALFYNRAVIQGSRASEVAILLLYRYLTDYLLPTLLLLEVLLRWEPYLSLN